MTIPSKPVILITKEEIYREVFRLAQEISIDYDGKNPLLLGILKGSFVFMADLVRLLEIPLEIEFVSLSSYGSAKISSGKVKVVKGLHSPLEGRDVLVVEDIVDTGLSTSYLLGYLHKRKPASVKLCALLDKPARRKTKVHIDYLGITIPDRFVVGYGLDVDEKFRNLPDLCILED
jgi:hypoxanthine phosphoribosyltransferase